ncbi:MAG: hypothetical protein ACLT98_16950 [Eggerthellaceae bacterium]
MCERLEACGATVVRTAARDGTWREGLARADVVLFCDDQEACVFSRTEAKSMRRARRGRMSVVFDLTERGCVDTGCVGFDDIFVYTLADLQGIDGGEDAVRAPSETSVAPHAKRRTNTCVGSTSGKAGGPFDYGEKRAFYGMKVFDLLKRSIFKTSEIFVRRRRRALGFCAPKKGI